jgi:hypothetical protein
MRHWTTTVAFIVLFCSGAESPAADNGYGNVSGWGQMVDPDGDCHFSVQQGAVAIGISFDIGPPPSFLVGAADERAVTMNLSEIVDPTRRTTGLHDDEVSLGAFENAIDVLHRRGQGDEAGLTHLGVNEAGDGVEFSEVKCEKLHCHESLYLLGGANVAGSSTLSASRVRVASHS